MASLRRLNPFAPTLSISLAAAVAIAAFVRPARVPAFRFSLTIGLEVFFLGIVMMKPGASAFFANLEKEILRLEEGIA